MVREKLLNFLLIYQNRDKEVCTEMMKDDKVTNRQLIPKVIHYCWFGNSIKPRLFRKCFQSWKKYCPDYEIIEWNEKNFNIDCCKYVREAYDAQKYAYVTDFARLWIIYNYGGVYLDTDVELIRSLDDLLYNSAYFGLEDSKHINTGLGFGAEKGNNIVKKMMEEYYNASFFNEDGSYNMMTCPVRNTVSIATYLPSIMGKDVIHIKDAVIYPPEFFCPLEPSCVNLNKTNNTYSIHWFSASWLSDEEVIIHDWRVFLGKCEKYLGKKVGRLFARIVYLFRPKKRNILKNADARKE